MDSHSKNVFLIGILHIVCYVLFSLGLTTGVISRISEHQFNGQLAIWLSCALGYCILTVIFAALMVRGVFKQSHFLVAPFLMFNSSILAVTFAIFLYRILVEFQMSLVCMYQYHLYMWSLHIMLLYPVYTLFAKLRLKYLKEKSLNDTISESEKKTSDILAPV